MKLSFVRVAENALLVRLKKLSEVHALFYRMAARRHAAVVELHPAYESLLIEFDPLSADEGEIRRWLEGLGVTDSAVPSHRHFEIPVAYGGSDGPDLDEVARLHNFTTDEVIRLHSEALYTVAFLGFQPGFAYLAGLSERLATPRLAKPRLKVPAGSVGIAGAQTGIYPFTSPGGWRIIGRTTLTLFDPQKDPAALLSMGDTVSFKRVERLA